MSSVVTAGKGLIFGQFGLNQVELSLVYDSWDWGDPVRFSCGARVAET